MPELFLRGPDALELLKKIGINRFTGFKPGMAKQLVGCAPSGHVIGDCILYYLEDDTFELVSGMTLLDWVEYLAESGSFDVSLRRDNATPNNPDGRTRFRFGVDGPAAWQVFREAVDGDAPDIPFFRAVEVTVAGCKVLALRHGMAGHKGVELSGDFAEGETVRARLLKVGAEHGLHAGGRLAYFSSSLESGWIPYPLPAIYTHPEMRGFREWLKAKSWEGSTHIAGSFDSDDIEDYYATVWDLGYERLVDDERDFVGSREIRRMATGAPRRKVSFEWDDEDVARIYRSLFSSDVRYKQLSLPLVSYGFPQCDRVETPEGELVGLSSYAGYSRNEGKVISLGSVDREFAEPGTKLRLIWGEPDGGRGKKRVEQHIQTSINVIVAPGTYSAQVRSLKRASLRKSA
ncbi:aminomethyltransferase family protein [Erythrobacter westpacificensis]|uniref:Aminomethyltransferase family protein n=2 Tax=Erythrobacter westpacificensis TaxID=1055231 RepID=A0ABP9KPC9_9SPHN